MPIIRRKYRTYATPGIFHSRHKTVWYAGRIPPCIPDTHLSRVTNTRCRIGMVFSPDDGHIVARNMYRITINILRIFVHKVGSVCKRLYKDERSTKHKINKKPCYISVCRNQNYSHILHINSCLYTFPKLFLYFCALWKGQYSSCE